MKKITLLALLLSVFIGYSQPTSNAPTPPTRVASDVISIYSDAYTDLSGTNFNPGWGQTGSVDDAYNPTGTGTNTVLAYTNFNYQGTQLSTAQDASGMENLHVDVWTATAGAVLKVSPINDNAGGGTGVAELLVNVTLVNAGWSSVDIPKSSFTGMTWDKVHQLKFDGGSGTTPSDVYVDNIYFWKVPTASGTDASLQTLEIGGAALTGFTSNNLTYSYGLPEGTTAVPQITKATPTDSNATAAITQATAIPGSATVVVTAQNGTTKQTYTVNFAVAFPGTNAPTPPTRVASDVISIYSDAYTDLSGTNFNPGWGQTGSVDAAYNPTGTGTNTVLAYTNFNYQGTQLSTAQDASGMENLHIDVWTATAGAVLKVSPINDNAGGGTGVAELLVNVTLVNAGWSSVDIPKSSFNGMTWDKVHQLKFDGGSGTTPSDVYVDNIYFWKSPTAGIDDSLLSSVKLFPNPANGVVKFSTRSGEALEVSVYDLLGKQVLPAQTVQSQLNISSLNPGMYFMKMKQGASSATKQLLVN